jgi:hypothetical protein
MYEGDVHFEHCYALDEGSASVDAKKECWRDWLHGYTYGQSRDRVEYGGTRYSQLSLDPTLPSEDVNDPSGRSSRRTVAGPVPTSAFAPPPNVMEGHGQATPGAMFAPPPNVVEGHASATAVAIVPVSAHAPGSDCAESCAQRWTRCRAACRDGACDVCDGTYRGCMPGCFRDETTAAVPERISR